MEKIGQVLYVWYTTTYFMYYVLSVSSSVLKTSKDAPCIQMHNTQETFPPFDEAFPLFAQTLCNKMLPMNPFELSKVV